MSKQLVRQWGILAHLQRHRLGATALDLAEAFHVSKNTIQRDLTDLTEAGFAVEDDEEARHRRRYRLAPGVAGLADVRPTSLEMLALHASRSLLLPLAGTPLYADLATLLEKLQAVMGPLTGALDSGRVVLPHLRGHKRYDTSDDSLEALLNATLKRRVCRVRYRAAWSGALREYELKPLRFFFHQGGLYLLASPFADKVATYAVERFESVEVTKTPFELPDVDLEAQLRGAFGVMGGPTEQVEVVFSADVALYVRERVWHPDQTLQDLPDGSVRFTAPMQGEAEILRWVLGWGADAELIRPAAWREALAGHARELARRYVGAAAG